MTSRGEAILEIVKRDSAKRLELVQSRVSSGRGAEIGATGLEVFSGQIVGQIAEHNVDWEGQSRFEIVDYMRRGDATVAATLSAVTLPIISTEAYVTAKHGEEEPDSVLKEAADLVNYILFSGDVMSRSWQQFLREGMLHLAYGHYPFEKVFTMIEGGEFAGAVGWKKFAPRHPSTIEEWNYNKHGERTGIKQRVTSDAAPDGDEFDIPDSKLIVFTNQEEANNALGVSIFRPAYKHWRYKDGFYAVQAIAIERQGAGVPYAKYPQGTPDPELDKTEEMLQNIQAHEQSYFMFGEDWEVGFTSMGAQSVLNPHQAIEHHDSMIPKTILAGFLNLPQDGKGSYALSSDSSGFFNFSLQSTANYFADVLTRQAIKELIDYNYPGLHKYPRLRFNRVGHLAMGQILEAIEKSVTSGVLTPDLALENRVRDYLNLPAIDESEFEEAKEEEEPEVAPQESGPDDS